MEQSERDFRLLRSILEASRHVRTGKKWGGCANGVQHLFLNTYGTKNLRSSLHCVYLN
jgi:hypothetical protein